VLATRGGEQALAKNYIAMCEEIAEHVTDELIAGSGHWVAEEKPDAFVRLFLGFDDIARN
jgi:pimeloyl-ACP methyl ester carboxylesterase